MRGLISSSIITSLKKINIFIIDEASDPALHFRLVPNSFPPVEALKFDISLILVSLLCDLKNHAIIDSVLHVQRFLIIKLIE
jgi:hypothetical protein